MTADIPLTPDILTELENRSKITPVKRTSDSTQFLLLLVMVAALLLSTLPILIQQTNKIFGGAKTNNTLPVLNPTPTPDSSLLFYIHKDN